MNYLYKYQVLTSYFYSYYDFESFVYINNILCILSKNNFIKHICHIKLYVYYTYLYIAKTKKKTKVNCIKYGCKKLHSILLCYYKLLENIDIIELLT